MHPMHPTRRDARAAPRRPAYLRPLRRLFAGLALALVTAATAAPVPAQQAPGRQQAPEALVQILTADLARVQTLKQEYVSATFLILGARPIREVRINGALERIEPDTLVVVQKRMPLPQRENLIEVSAQDTAGNRRDKSFLVIRELPPPRPLAERRDEIIELIDTARFQEARVELGLWEQESGGSPTIAALQRRLAEAFDKFAEADVREALDERRFAEAALRLEQWATAGGTPSAVETMREVYLRTKRTVLHGRIQEALLAGHMDAAETLLADWERAGDSPRIVAGLREVLTEWRNAPPIAVVVEDIPANTLVQLQVRALSRSQQNWMPDETLRLSEIRTIGTGPGRYPLPGPGLYSLEFINEGVHDRWVTAIDVDPSQPVITVAPKLPYVMRGEWETLPDLPEPRGAPSVVRVGARLLVSGGYAEYRFGRAESDQNFVGRQGAYYLLPRDVSRYVQSDVWFDTAQQQWEPRATTYGGRSPTTEVESAVRVGMDLVLVGANESVRRLRVERMAYSDDLRLTTEGLPWESAKAPLIQIGPPAVVAYQGAVYQFGGAEVLQLPSTDETVTPVPSDKVWRLELATGEWKVMPPLPVPRMGAAVALVGDSVYVAGGHDGQDFRNEVFRFDPIAEVWNTVPIDPMPTARAWAAAAVVNGLLYVIGGEYNAAFGGTTVADGVEIFDPETGRWREGPDMPTARKHAGVVVAGGDIYVIGGADGSEAVDAVEVLR